MLIWILIILAVVGVYWTQSLRQARRRWLERLDLPGSWQWQGEEGELELSGHVDGGRYRIRERGGDEAGEWRVTGHTLVLMPDPQRKGVFCAPADPTFDEKAADELANETHTDASDWAFPLRDGIEVRATAKQDSPVVDKLGMYLVRVLSDDSPLNAVMATSVKVLTPAGKVGYVPIETILPLGGEQLCYLKEAGGWKIAGFLGGEANQ